MCGARAFLFAFSSPVPGKIRVICHPKSYYMEEVTMKKHSTLKKFFALAAAAALSISLFACSGGENTPTGNPDDGVQTTTPSQQGGDTQAPETQQPSGGGTYKIAIIKLTDHPSLDEIANAVAARLDEIAAENGVTIEYDITSGQGDPTVLRQLSDQAIADGVDAIIPIATAAAQMAVLSAEATKTPVIFSAVSYPADAKIDGIDYVSGISDALNTGLILDMMLAQNPSVSKVGLLYSLSEINSATPIAEAKAYLDGKGIAYVEQTANTNDEVIAAASALIAAGVDAVFTPTDNIIASAELAIAPSLIDAGIPHYAGADSFVRNGAFATCGVNYTQLGRDTADLAYRAVTEGMSGMEDYYLAGGGIITVNTETAAVLDIGYSMFSDMGTVVEVVTTED